jgi:nucleoside phosphorylase
MINKADILIVTVTEVESRAVMKVFREATGKDSKPEPIGDRIYLDLGEVNGSRVFMALSGMGTGGIGGSQEGVRKGIEALSPSAVIMVGIAFGINEQKQAIGDVLVSEQLMLYDLQRVGTGEEGGLEIILRGDRPHASPWLINRLQVAKLSWDESKANARFGLILSGDKLVDNIDFRRQLLKFEPQAIGGEMEGGGLYVACQNSKVDWILVKAICDWADGQKAKDKDARQQLAAHNAAAFMLHALLQAPLKQARTNIESPGMVSTSSIATAFTWIFVSIFFFLQPDYVGSATIVITLFFGLFGIAGAGLYLNRIRKYGKASSEAENNDGVGHLAAGTVLSIIWIVMNYVYYSTIIWFKIISFFTFYFALFLLFTGIYDSILFRLSRHHKR